MPSYRGRFAPSPSGPLHFGSLIAAAASFLDARSLNGSWILRIEDLDRARVRPGAADAILATLDSFGFEWHGPVLRQSQRTEAYRQAFHRLQSAGHLYPCACTRKEIADSVTHPADNAPRYPGACANGLPPGRTPRAWRVRTSTHEIAFHDRLQGPHRHNLAHESGDFILLRADGLFAYQLAVVVDDAAQHITDVVRGADLLDSTPRQIHLQRLLGLHTPRYLHIPVAVDAAGVKLSKQTSAHPVDPADAPATLRAALRFLNHTPPESLHTIPEIWQWAIAAWTPANIPAVPSASA